jgi:hypothetical protein
VKKPVGTRNQAALLGLLVLGLAFLLIRRGGEATTATNPTAAAPAQRAATDGAEAEAPVRGRRASRSRQATADDVQVLTKAQLEEADRASRAEVSRNLFDFREPSPVPTIPPVPTRTIPPTFGPPPPTFTPGPTFTPVPPEIPFRFVGSFGPRENPIATLVNGEQVVNARAGQVVFDHFIVRKVGYESLDIGFVRYPPSVMRRLPIAP